MKKVSLLCIISLIALQMFCSASNTVESSMPDLTKYAVTPKKYSFSLTPASYGGYETGEVVDNKQYYYPDFKIKDVTYYADEILIKKITKDKARLISDKFEAYDFILANPDKRTKLQPVKHKWVINSTHGILTEERTLYVFGKENDNYTFTTGVDEELDKDFLSKSDAFRFREAPNKQPPVVDVVGAGGRPSYETRVDAWQLNSLYNRKENKK